MDEMVYEALSRYYNTLEKTGYMSYDNAVKLLVLTFLKDFVFNDYRCTISKDDYRLIERALNCLYGSTCLIPYPDYLKMGKLRLGSMSELACRVKTLENTNVVKVIHDLDSVINKNEASDILVLANETDVVTNVNTGGSSNYQGNQADVGGVTPFNPGNSGSQSGGTISGI